MKHFLVILIVLSSLAGGAKEVNGIFNNEITNDTLEYKLIWSDEFDEEGVFNPAKWTYANRGRVAWNKYITQDPRYVFQADGQLVLRMDNSVVDGDDIPYHSGGVQTMGKFTLQYGKVVVRAKFTQGRGSWPAIWMMPDPAHSLGTWPLGGEIDIMEHVNNEQVVHQTIHNAEMTNASGASKATHKSSYNLNEFNTYSIIWTENVIDFYVNDRLQYSYKKTENASIKEWPFDVPFYIILNQSGGAGWPGPITDADLPFSMEVDYVRVYKPSNSPK